MGPIASLDEQKISVLRTWGAGLERDEREEVAAAGRAILLLVDEVEQLHVDLWHARTIAAGVVEPAPEQPAEDVEPEPEPPPTRSSLGATLRQRLKSVGQSRAD